MHRTALLSYTFINLCLFLSIWSTRTQKYLNELIVRSKVLYLDCISTINSLFYSSLYCLAKTFVLLITVTPLTRIKP